jgi:hypothetical protein
LKYDLYNVQPVLDAGVMVWCRDCDSFHDKQRVWDDRDYCRATYDSLMMTDGFADILRDGPAPPATAPGMAAATNVAGLALAVRTESDVALAALPIGFASAPDRAVSGEDEDAEWDGEEDVVPRPAGAAATHGARRIDPDEKAVCDESETAVLPARKAARVARRVTSDGEGSARGTDCAASSAGSAGGACKQQEGERETHSLATRTQSDTTTCSSRSRMTAVSQMDECGVPKDQETRKRTAVQASDDSPSKRTRSNNEEE